MAGKQREPLAERLLSVIEAQSVTIQNLGAQLLELKKDGFQPKPAAPTKHKKRDPEISDDLLVRQREQETVERMKADFIRQGVTPAAAEREARRIRAETTRTTVHPTE